MKKLLLLVLMSSVMGAAVLAQDQKDMKADHQQWEQKMKTELKLTDDQATKFDALSKEYGDKMEAVKNDASLTKDAQKAKKMELKKEKEGKLFEFLTPEQQTKYRSMVAEKKKEKPAGQ
jgi:Spy/CpxP family protein refolding chaperone